MTLIDDLEKDILADGYFLSLFRKAERVSANDPLGIAHNETISEKEYRDLMRFADILSHSKNADARNKSYKIVSLLVKSFGASKSFNFFASAILAKLGNFPALTFLRNHHEYFKELPLEREAESRIKTEVQKTSDSKGVFTDAQYQIRQDLETFDYFSFSGPTSIGKSFILMDFIRHLLTNNASMDEGAIVILVPTRALISQVVEDLRKNIDHKTVNILSYPVLSSYSAKKFKQHVFVFTPERLLSYIKPNSPNIKYLFVDEAQKIISVNDPRSSLYYHAIYETSKRYAAKIVFASPNIPNPDIMLKIFEKNSQGARAVKEQTVAQNRFFVDFGNKTVSLFSDLGDEQKLLGFNFDAHPRKFLERLGSGAKNIVYCNGVSETVSRAKEFAAGLPEVKDKEVDKLVEFASEYVHKDYYLIECLKRGVGFHHGRMPQRIRRKVERLFAEKDSSLRYVFCTSTLLEGVNLPAKNIFIFNENHGSHEFEKIDFENLIGRAGRLTKEFSGNVICVRDNEKRWADGGGLLKRVVLDPVDSFVVNKEAKKKKEFSNIGKVLSNGKLSQNLRVGEKENLTHYASLVLLHHIEKEGSVLKAGFFEKNKDALDILKKAEKANNVPAEIIRLSSTIKPVYQNKALEYIQKHGEGAKFDLDSEDNQIVRSALEVLYDLYNWKEEESSGRESLIPPGLVKAGYGKSHLGYWAMLLRNWTRAEPLSRLIVFSIKYHHDQKKIWFHENGVPTREDFVGNQKQINIIIEQIMNDTENGLRFKIEKYLKNYYLLLKHVLGEDKAGKDWSQFIEYGTTNPKIIELQILGFSRGASKYLLGNHADSFIFDAENRLIEIRTDDLLSAVDKKSEHYEEAEEILG